MAGAALTTKEAANYLGISTSTVYRMTRNGELRPSKTPGGQRRFDISDLNRYKERSRSFTAPQTPSGKRHGEIVDPRNKLNELSGREWMPLTKSFFFQKGLGKSAPEAQIELQHPAPFSYQDVVRFVSFFTKSGQTVLDPFGGVGSTAKACELSKRKCISIELSKKWHDLAIERLETEVGKGSSKGHLFVNDDCISFLPQIEPESVDFVITSPPYWSILNKRADHKVKRERVAKNLATNYSDQDPRDLANIGNYRTFIETLTGSVFIPCARALRENAYMCIIVSDFRDKSQFVSFHSDLIQALDGAIIGTGGRLALQGTQILLQNHKSLMPYGYPFAYVENIHHQYVLIFRKVK